MSFSILVINPGSTSTKLALFQDERVLREEKLEHDAQLIAGTERIADQLPMREKAVMSFLDAQGQLQLDAVCARGGPLRPLPGGSYLVDEAMLADLRVARHGEHASLLGGLLAWNLAQRWRIPAYVVDPITVDELADKARISGIPEIERTGRCHALNIKAVTRLAAAELGVETSRTRFVVAHMGGGISVAAVEAGHIVDVNDALLGMGPFTPYRAGALPLRGLLELAFAPGAERRQLERRLSTQGGLYAYLGTGDLKEVEERIRRGDAQSHRIYEAMTYQIAKEIGAMAAALGGRLDGLIFTGGMSHSETLIEGLRRYTQFLGRIFHYPGEREMKALAAGALRVLRGEEKPMLYGDRK